MKTLRPSLDASGKKMRARKLIDVTGTLINPKTNKKVNMKMMNFQFGGSKLNLCSLTTMTDSGWKMSGDTTGIHLSKETK